MLRQFKRALKKTRTQTQMQCKPSLFTNITSVLSVVPLVDQLQKKNEVTRILVIMNLNARSSLKAGGFKKFYFSLFLLSEFTHQPCYGNNLS